MTIRFRCLLRALAGAAVLAAAAEPVLFEDFEAPDYGAWTAEGTAFGNTPASGTLDKQNPVSGFSGSRLVNSFLGGDGPTGTLTSPPFVVRHAYINFLIGGGSHRNRTCMDLVIDGTPERTATGENAEALQWFTWDVTSLAGREATLRIVDNATEGWGHINVDRIEFSDDPRTVPRGDPASEKRRDEERRERLLARARRVGVRDIVFTVRRVDPDGHWYANFSTWSDNPGRKLYHDGTRLCRLDLQTGAVTVLLDDPAGGVRDPAVHYDGDRILLSYRQGGQPYYHLFEIGADGTGLRRLTDGPFDDIEPTYLPDGGIAFCSSRCNRMVNCYYVRVASLYRCEADGSGIRMLSSNIEQDNTPWVLPDGRILHQRWEYIDRNQVSYHHLWTMNPDGTGQTIFYGNMHAGTAMLDAKPIPGTGTVLASFSPGHGRNEHDGYITVVDPGLGPDRQASARRVSEEIFRDPYPLAADCFLAANDTDIVLLDENGEWAPVYSLPPEWRAEDGRTKVHEPRPLLPHPREHVIPPRTVRTEPEGVVMLEDVTRGRNMDGVEPGEIRQLLVLEALPKPVNFTGGWEPVSLGGTFTLERILGTVPVEKDGSAHMRLPALRSLFFVALDAEGRSVKRMQSFMTVQPGETLSCVGCHEERLATPRNRGRLLAMERPPSPVEPVPGVPAVIDFPRDIQPVLDRLCTDCHGYRKTERGGPRSGKVILTGDHGPMYSHAYVTLTVREQFTDGRNGEGNIAPRGIGSGRAPLLDKLTGRHHDVQATDREVTLVRLWIDSAAAYPGTYAALGTGMIGRYGPPDGWGPETDDVIKRRCAECHEGDRRLPNSPADDVLALGFGGTRVNGKDPRFAFSNHVVYNLTRPKHSLLLRVPLAEGAGGLSPTNAEGKPHKEVFATTDDPDYRALHAAISRTGEQLARMKRFDMPGFRPNGHYVREMKFYGILPPDLPDDAPIDVYETDRKYWDSFVYRPPRE